MDTKAEMDGTMVELLGGIETIRALDSARTESGRIEAQSEQLRRKEMRHHKAMALYDCLKFVNEAVFSVLVIGISVLLASRRIITIGTVLTAYLCFTQLTGPLRELHRILDEFSECIVLAGDYFRLLDLPRDFSYAPLSPETNATPQGNDITLRGVRFSYPEKPDRPILRQMDLQIRAGTFVGVAGPSGCGKSTLIKVIDKLEQAEAQSCWAEPRFRICPAGFWQRTLPWFPRPPFSSPIPSITTSAMVFPEIFLWRPCRMPPVKPTLPPILKSCREPTSLCCRRGAPTCPVASGSASPWLASFCVNRAF